MAADKEYSFEALSSLGVSNRDYVYHRHKQLSELRNGGEISGDTYVLGTLIVDLLKRQAK